jgi:mRNA interferase MazF
MRVIHLVRGVDKTRPALVLTRAHMLGRLTSVTVAPITSTVRGIPTEVPVDSRNGLDQESVVNLDNVMTIPARDLGRHVGYFYDHQEPALAAALIAAYDLAAVPR